LINLQGKELIPAKFPFLGTVADGLCVVNRDAKWGVYNLAGKEVLATEYDNILLGFDNNSGNVRKVPAIIAVRNKKYALYSRDGKALTSFEYDNIHPGFADAEKITFFKRNNLTGFIDMNGKEVIPPIHEAVTSIFKGIFWSVKSGRLALFNKKGEQLTDFKYSGLGYEEFKSGYAAVQIDDKLGFVNLKGQEVVPVKYDKILSDFEKGKAKVVLNGRELYVDPTGKEL
jgi:hypothetical protein